MKSISTKDLGVVIASNFESMLDPTKFGSTSYYALIGKAAPWANTTGALDDSSVSEVYDTVETKNNLLKEGIFLKRITNYDLHPVIPRVDWAEDYYTEYNQTANLFIKTIATQISGGNVNVSLSLANTVRSNTINFNLASPGIQAGSIIKIGQEVKEVVSVNTGGDFLQVNTNFTSAYTRANVFKLTTSTVQYGNKFYVKNSKDQVFKCLFNNNGAISTIQPETTIGGQSPQNPYVVTSDGYKWKYMYTIPSGLKQKFFTNDYMPVHKENITTESAVGGRIDVIKITNGGTGYYQGLTTTNYGASSGIFTVKGDGTGARVSADITNGVITNINILDGGSGYSTATISISDPLQLFTGTSASLSVVIGPSGGHGSDPESELGASYRMLSVDFSGDINGLLPVDNSGNDTFRQIGIIKNPTLRSTGSIAFSTTGFSLCGRVQVSGGAFSSNTIVYVGSSYATATFSGRVVHFDSDTRTLYINTINGTFTQAELGNKTIYEKDNTGINGVIVQVTPSDINTLSGQVLYIENRAKVTRSPDQTESTRIVFAF